MFVWTLRNQPPANVMLISDDELYIRSLGIMRMYGFNILWTYLPECMQDMHFPTVGIWKSILEDAMGSGETPRNELQEQCTWFCKLCDLDGVQTFDNFITHLKSEDHAQRMSVEMGNNPTTMVRKQPKRKCKKLST